MERVEKKSPILRRARRGILAGALVLLLLPLPAHALTAPFYYQIIDESTWTEEVPRDPNATPEPKEEARKVTLNADKVVYDEGTGVATAEGDVRVVDRDVRLGAPFVEYDSSKMFIRAQSEGGEDVILVTEQGVLRGKEIEYNMDTRHGVMRDASGRTDALILRGKSIEVMPLEDALKEKWGVRNKGEKITPEEMAARWLEVSTTTCTYPTPHYRLESKEIIATDFRTIVKKPKVYLGNRMIFSYPFDYVIEHEKKRGTVILPVIGYESDKGAGLGFSAPIAWDSGMLGIDFTAWTEGIWEGRGRIEQDVLFPGMSVFGEVRREWNKDTDDTEWRPSWGVDYDMAGWKLYTKWTQRELVTIQKRSGEDKRYTIWRDPEFGVTTPWWRDPATRGWWRLHALYGRYEDTTLGAGAPTYDRLGGAVELWGSPPSRGVLKPFYSATYWYFDYDNGDYSNQTLDLVLGVKARSGQFDFMTAYVRRWVWGYSPMLWDDFEERKDLYQEIALTLPTKRPDENWIFSVRGAYDFIDEKISEVAYKVTYDKHCLAWELIFRDDRRSSNDDWIGLSLTIKAYPQRKAQLGMSELYDPAKRPDSLKEEDY